MFPKKFYASKSFWFFVLTLVVSVAGLFGFGEFQPSAQQAEIAGIVVALVGIVLRFVTKEPVEL